MIHSSNRRTGEREYRADDSMSRVFCDLDPGCVPVCGPWAQLIPGDVLNTRTGRAQSTQRSNALSVSRTSERGAEARVTSDKWQHMRCDNWHLVSGHQQTECPLSFKWPLALAKMKLGLTRLISRRTIVKFVRQTELYMKRDVTGKQDLNGLVTCY